NKRPRRVQSLNTPLLTRRPGTTATYRPLQVSIGERPVSMDVPHTANPHSVLVPSSQPLACASKTIEPNHGQVTPGLPSSSRRRLASILWEPTGSLLRVD